MKINITKKQYWDLMRSVYMADWMANAICEEGMEEDGGIKDIRDYIFSFAKEMGREDYVEYGDELGKHYATWDIDDEPSIRGLIDRYDDSTFWDEISERLGRRDFLRKYTKQEREKMTDDEHFTKLTECQVAWEEEFEKHGIDRLEIRKE